MPRQMILRVCGGSVKLGWLMTYITATRSPPINKLHHWTIRNTSVHQTSSAKRPVWNVSLWRTASTWSRTITEAAARKSVTNITNDWNFTDGIYGSSLLIDIYLHHADIGDRSAEQCYISRTNAIITHHWHSPLLARSHPSNMGSFETKVIPQSHMIPVGGRSSAWSFLSYSTGSSYQLMSRSNIDLRYHSCHYCHGGIRLGRAG